MRQPHILLLEDEPTIRDVLLDLFALEGLRVTVCFTVADLWAAVEQHPGSVVVSDSWSPRSMHFDDVLRAEIVALGKLTHVVLIGTETWANDVLEEDLGVTVVPAPFDLDDLVQAVRHASAIPVSRRDPLAT